MYVLSHGKLTTIADATVRKYGEAAYSKACTRASTLEAMKDEAGAVFWQRIAETIRREHAPESRMLSA
ncbi:MAG: hypothetical protein ACREF6_10685 [Alphaproteobacteria bacterium]